MQPGKVKSHVALYWKDYCMIDFLSMILAEGQWSAIGSYFNMLKAVKQQYLMIFVLYIYA